MAVVCEPTTPTKFNSVVVSGNIEPEESVGDTYESQSQPSSETIQDHRQSIIIHEQHRFRNMTSSRMSPPCQNPSTTVTSKEESPSLPPRNHADTTGYIWTTSYQANDPSEDRYASLTNVELMIPSDSLCNSDSAETDADSTREFKDTIIHMNMFSVFDGHGGSAVSEFASLRLLPLLKNNISKALGCMLSQDGTFNINGKVISCPTSSFKNSASPDRKKHSPLNEEEEDSGFSGLDSDDESATATQAWYQAPDPLPSSTTNHNLIFPAQHSPLEREIVQRTIQETFIQLDEMWINSIDTRKKQHTMYHNGTWNVGSCALVNILLQREEGGERGVGILYSAHTGDCKSALMRVIETKDNIDEDAVTLSSQGTEEEGSRSQGFPESPSDPQGSFGQNNINSDDEGDDHDDEVAQIQSGAKRRRFETYIKDSLENNLPAKRINPSQENNNNHGVSGTSVSCSNYDEHKHLLPTSFSATALTKDHTPYNNKEASLVRQRSNYAPRAISSSISGGIQRVAGSLSVTRALGDAYLKTPILSFGPYKEHAPYISALPEVSSRLLTGRDRFLVLGSDGLWERSNEKKVGQWMGTYFKTKNQENIKWLSNKASDDQGTTPKKSESPVSVTTPPPNQNTTSTSSSGRRSNKKRMLPTRKCHIELEDERIQERILAKKSVSDLLVYKILNHVRRKQRIPSVRAIMGLPRGNARRCKHDDITVMVVDLQGYL